MMTTNGIDAENESVKDKRLDTEAPEEKWYKRILVLVPAACVLIIMALLLEFVFYLGFVPTSSMEPTISAGSLIFGTRIYNNLRDGDIVVFNHNGTTLVKRIAAGPGETIDWKDYPQTDRSEEYTTIPDNCWFMLGDNTENSADARYWDDPFVETKDIKAKLFFH